MDFFKTSDGRLHGGRVAGVLYIIGLLPNCLMALSSEPAPKCIMQLTYTAGWWLAFCGKSPALAARDLLSLQRLLGVVLVALGLIGSFYVVGNKWPR
jgi:hypothetical protein